MPTKYHECLTVTCPTFKCSTSDNGALLEVSCAGACADDYSPGNETYTQYCAEDNGISEYQTLPAWQECCVTYADLVHPGQPHAGTANSACSEITTASVFVQILVASEFMIFPVRALGWMFMNRARSVPPSAHRCCLSDCSQPTDAASGVLSAHTSNEQDLAVCSLMLDAVTGH